MTFQSAASRIWSLGHPSSLRGGFVGYLAQGCERIRRRHGYGEDQPRGAAAPHSLQGDPHRRTGGDAVIDNDRYTLEISSAGRPSQ